MAQTDFLTETPLVKACSTMRGYFETEAFWEPLLKDTKKTGDFKVYDRPLSNTPSTKDYVLSVHHRCEEKPLPASSSEQGLMLLEGWAYIDCMVKINKKATGNNIFDTLNIFSWTAITELAQNNLAFDADIHDWAYGGLNDIYVPGGEKKVLDLDDPTLFLIAELKIRLFYANFYQPGLYQL